MEKNKLSRTIYCPICAREIYKIRDKQTMNVTVRCECGRYFEIDALHRLANQIQRPERLTSSGVTFH